MSAADDLAKAARELVEAVQGADVLTAFDDAGRGPYLALRDRGGFAVVGGITQPARRLREALLRFEAAKRADAEKGS